MKLLNAARKVRHSQDRVRRMSGRRNKAKNQVLWDVINGAAMDYAIKRLAADREDLKDLLKKEGYFRWAQ